MALTDWFAELPKAANNEISGLRTKVGEAASYVAGAFNGSGSFNRIASQAPNFVQTAAQQTFDRLAVAQQQLQGTVTSAIDDYLWETGVSPYTNNAIDALNAAIAEDRAKEQSVTAAQQAAVNNRQETDTSHMVKLVERGITQVVFRVMPEVVESRTVEYEAIAPPQVPTAFQKYKGTSSTQWTVNATLICRTTDEATENLRILNTLRGWTMPFFGVRTAEVFPNKLGAPPPVLEFSGWRNQMVGPVQVVLTSLNWNFPQDVDYIPANEYVVDPDSNGTPGLYRYTGKQIPFPTVIKLAIQLVESFSTDQLNGFSLNDFRAGRFAEAFRPLPKASLNQNPTTIRSQGTQQPEQEAQQLTPFAGAFRGTRSDTSPAQRVVVGLGASVAGGRGNIIPEAASVSTPNVVNPSPFVSGGGGDFGGGGASGSFEVDGDV